MQFLRTLHLSSYSDGTWQCFVSSKRTSKGLSEFLLGSRIIIFSLNIS